MLTLFSYSIAMVPCVTVRRACAEYKRRNHKGLKSKAMKQMDSVSRDNEAPFISNEEKVLIYNFPGDFPPRLSKWYSRVFYSFLDILQ